MDNTPYRHENNVSIRIFSDGFYFFKCSRQGDLLSSHVPAKISLLDKNTDELLETFPDLRGPFHQIEVWVETGFYSLIPPIFNDEKQFRDILRLHQPALPPHMEVFSVPVFNHQAIAIYALPIAWVQKIQQLFPNIVPQFHLAPLLTNKSSKEQTSYTILWLRETEMDVIVVQNNAPILLNNYNYRAPEDLLYYTLNIYKELHLDNNTHPLTIYHNPTYQPTLLFSSFFGNLTVQTQAYWHENYQWKI